MQVFEYILPSAYAVLGILAFFAILFLQSGFNKVFDRKGNLDWMVPHFANSPFRNLVPFLVTIVTIVELAVGFMCLVSFISHMLAIIELRGTSGTIYLQFGTLTKIALAGCLVALLQLFLGQRVAKDYAGAASLAGYFAVAILGLTLL